MQTNLLFLDGKKFGHIQIPSLSSDLEESKEARCAGGSPSSNSAAYSQLGEMPHAPQRLSSIMRTQDTLLTYES